MLVVGLAVAMAIGVIAVAVALVAVTLTRRVGVPGGALVGLRGQHVGRDTGRMVEHQPAAVDRGGDQHARSAQRDRERQRPLRGAHPPLPDDPPDRQHAEDAQRDQRRGARGSP